MVTSVRNISLLQLFLLHNIFPLFYIFSKYTYFSMLFYVLFWVTGFFQRLLALLPYHFFLVFFGNFLRGLPIFLLNTWVLYYLLLFFLFLKCIFTYNPNFKKSINLQWLQLYLFLLILFLKCILFSCMYNLPRCLFYPMFIFLCFISFDSEIR